MRKESRTLHAKAVDSLVLAVDHFNRAWDRGRTEAVLILLDRSFELLLKAIIVARIEAEGHSLFAGFADRRPSRSVTITSMCMPSLP